MSFAQRLILIIAVVAVASCQARQVPVETATARPVEAAGPTNQPLSTPTPTPLASGTGQGAATTLSPPATEKGGPGDSAVIQKCVEVLPAVSLESRHQGIIPLEDYQTGRTVFMDLATGDKVSIPAIERFASASEVSPDHQTLAYKVHEDGSWLLILRDALDRHHRVVLQRQVDFALSGWINKEQLLLGKDGKDAIFNPYTGEEKTYSFTQLPDYDFDRWYGNIVDLDPSASLAIYKNAYTDISLLDVGSETVLAEIPDPTDRPPLAVWSPDGEQAAIVGGTQVGKFPSQVGDNLFAVNRHGKVTQLTHLAEQFGEGVNVHSLSWSPDSRHVAFWLWRPGMEPFQWSLAILDTTTGAITDYCISTNPYAANRAWWAGLSAPIWSPDSNQLVVEHWTDDAKDVILLDADQGIAYRLAQNMAPIGWMTSE